jgi:hypothetical protein
MTKLTAAEPQGERDNAGVRGGDAPRLAADDAKASLIGRLRLMMFISLLTTLIAIAAVIGVIGYRVYRSGGSGAPAEAIVTLPKTARVMSTAVSGDRIVVTLDTDGVTEIRTFDVKTLHETGRIRFATEP